MTPELRERAMEAERLVKDILPELQAAIRDSEQTDYAYRQAHATALLAASGTAVDKKAQADKASAPEMERRNQARANRQALEAAYYAHRDILKKVTAEIFAEKEEMRLAG